MCVCVMCAMLVMCAAFPLCLACCFEPPTTISPFVADDWESVEVGEAYPMHSNRVTGICYDIEVRAFWGKGGGCRAMWSGQRLLTIDGRETTLRVCLCDRDQRYLFGWVLFFPQNDWVISVGHDKQIRRYDLINNRVRTVSCVSCVCVLVCVSCQCDFKNCIAHLPSCSRFLPYPAQTTIPHRTGRLTCH